jgi:hypothetical protein
VALGNGYWQLPADLIDGDRIPSTRLPLVRITGCSVPKVPELYENNPVYCLSHPVTRDINTRTWSLRLGIERKADDLAM